MEVGNNGVGGVAYRRPVADIAYPIAERTLANGLRVVVSEDHTVPTVTVNLWVGVGSRHEPAGRTGFAHLFEHLMFQGSRNVKSGEHFSALMAEGGRLNATTWFDRTNYFETIPKGALELALWLEADRHGHLLDAVTQENLDNQRDVVKEEKRQRYDNVPYGNALVDVYATVFPEGHPYHHPTIGSMEDLDAASLEDVHAFFRHYYGPNNAVLTIVGDVEPEDAFAKVETYFGRLPASARASVCSSVGASVVGPPNRYRTAARRSSPAAGNSCGQVRVRTAAAATADPARATWVTGEVSVGTNARLSSGTVMRMIPDSTPTRRSTSAEPSFTIIPAAAPIAGADGAGNATSEYPNTPHQ